MFRMDSIPSIRFPITSLQPHLEQTLPITPAHQPPQDPFIHSPRPTRVADRIFPATIHRSPLTHTHPHSFSLCPHNSIVRHRQSQQWDIAANCPRVTQEDYKFPHAQPLSTPQKWPDVSPLCDTGNSQMISAASNLHPLAFRSSIVDGGIDTEGWFAYSREHSQLYDATSDVDAEGEGDFEEPYPRAQVQHNSPKCEMFQLGG